MTLFPSSYWYEVGTLKVSAILVLGLKRNLFSSSAVAKKGVKTVIEKNGSSLDL